MLTEAACSPNLLCFCLQKSIDNALFSKTFENVNNCDVNKNLLLFAKVQDVLIKKNMSLRSFSQHQDLV